MKHQDSKQTAQTVQTTKNHLLSRWVELYVKQLENPSPLASDHLTIPPPCYLRLIYPDEKSYGIDTIQRFFSDVEHEANMYLQKKLQKNK